MATILKFKQQADQNRAKGARRSRSSAEIIIFPGIRYERWEEQSKASEPLPQRASRDILTLVD